MSWDSYIDNLIAQSKDTGGNTHCDKACIIGLDGGAPWTTAGHANALKVCEKALYIFCRQDECCCSYRGHFKSVQRLCHAQTLAVCTFIRSLFVTRSDLINH